MAPQQQTVGGLGAMAPAKPQGAPSPEPSEAKDAARISSMEQEQTDTPANMMDRAIQRQREAARALETQTALLRQSYDARTSLPFDPKLMALSAGLLQPTKTGGFGESLGYGVEKYAAEAEKEQLRKQQAEKQKMELSQQELAMGTKNLEFEHMLQMAGYNPAKATTLTGGAGAPSPTGMPPAAGAAPVGGARPAAVGAPAAPANVGQTGAPNELPPITDRDITTAYAISKEHGDKIAAIAKMQREDLVVNEGNVFSRSQKKYLDVTPPNEKPAEYYFGPAGDRKTTPDVYREYRKIIEGGTEDQLRDFFIRQRWLAGAPSGAPRIGAAGTAGTPPAIGAAPVGGATPAGKPPAAGGAGGMGLPTRFKTAEEIAQEKIANEAGAAEAKKYAEGAGEMASNLRESAFSAPDVKSLAQEAGSIAKAAPNAFKLLMNKDSGLRDELDGYLQLVKTGAQTPFGTFSIPADIIERNGLKDTEIQALQKYAQIEAQFTLFNRRLWLKGQGAISNGENAVAAQLGPQAGDRPEVIQMKAQAIERKADFDEQTFLAFEQWREANPAGGFSKFIAQSPEFKALKTEYIADLKAMRESNARHFSGEKKPVGTPTPAPAAPAPSANKAPNSESYSDRLKRLQKERGG